jgi:prepilin-type N-terminal cleavage/methylation domain-containing protein
MRSQRQSGFSLVELMVVIALVGIIAMLAIPSPEDTPIDPAQQSDELVSTLGLARLRATVTRRIHRVHIEPQLVTMSQATTVGFKTPTAYDELLTSAIPPYLSVWNVATSVVPGGASPAKSSTLSIDIDFRPDGSASSAATIYVTDASATRKHRVYVYKVTGSSYARGDW